VSINLENLVIGIYVALILLFVLGKALTFWEQARDEARHGDDGNLAKSISTPQQPSADMFSNANAPPMTEEWKQGATERIMRQSIWCPKCGDSKERREYSRGEYASKLWCVTCGSYFTSLVPNEDELWRVFFAECPNCSNVELRLHFEAENNFKGGKLACPRCKQQFAEPDVIRKWSGSSV